MHQTLQYPVNVVHWDWV